MSTRTLQRTDEEQRLIDDAGRATLLFDGTLNFVRAVRAERRYQDRKWGKPPLHTHTISEWALVLTKEFSEAIAELYALNWGDHSDAAMRLRRELVQVAAVCGAICEELPATAPGAAR